MSGDDRFDRLYEVGLAAAVRGDWPAAEQALRAAVEARPDHPDALRNHGVSLRRLGQAQAALACYDASLRLAPGVAETLAARANLLNELSRFAEALADADAALAAAPGFPVAANARGNALVGLGRPQDAVDAYRLAARAAGYAEAWVNLGSTLLALGKASAALEACDAALAIDPRLPAAWMGRANALAALRRWAEADAAYACAAALDPNQPFLAGQSLHARMKVCDWSGFDAAIAALRRGLERGASVSPPFPLLALPLDESALRAGAQAYVRATFPSQRPAPTPRPEARIRLAYVSADFHDHATAHLLADLIECHDRGRFEVTALSFGPPADDPMRRRLKAGFDRFFDVGGLDDTAVAELARGLGVDIAIDLKGYTTGARPGVFAARAAPLQVNWLGFPGTMAAPFIDYLVADPIVLPPTSREHYAEAVAWMPACYQPNDRQRPCPPRSTTRSDHGLPEAGFVFGAFNNPYKILPGVFASWMRILQAIEGSVLWLLADNPAAPQALRRAAAQAGVDPARLVFAPFLPRERHLERHRHMDLFLDTTPYNAHTTASDALWMGTPLVTQRGETFAGRVAESLLRAAGLPQLVAATAAEYEALAMALARDPARLVGLRSELTAARPHCALFDTPRFARDLESLYVAMHKRRLAGEAPIDLGPW